MDLFTELKQNTERVLVVYVCYTYSLRCRAEFSRLASFISEDGIHLQNIRK